ncbi:MAG TPA: hypothetical protein VLE73_05830 [Candidatus Saccharimonadales bacterium]|nr:hypothetical protein [Candidatus Saccharimonadales bacterium]
MGMGNNKIGNITPIDLAQVQQTWQELMEDADYLGLSQIARAGLAAAAILPPLLRRTHLTFNAAPHAKYRGKNHQSVYASVVQAVTQLEPDTAPMGTAGIAALMTIQGIRALSCHPKSELLRPSDGIGLFKLRLDLNGDRSGIAELAGIEKGAFMDKFNIRWHSPVDGRQVLEIAARMYPETHFLNYRISTSQSAAGHHLEYQVVEAEHGFLSLVAGNLPMRFVGLGRAMVLGASHTPTS